jgi:ATP-dependent DNA ligase
VLATAGAVIRFNEHMEFEDGETVFRYACKMGHEAIVSKRLGSWCRSGRSPDWLERLGLSSYKSRAYA